MYSSIKWTKKERNKKQRKLWKRNGTINILNLLSKVHHHKCKTFLNKIFYSDFFLSKSCLFSSVDISCILLPHILFFLFVFLLCMCSCGFCFMPFIVVSFVHKFIIMCIITMLRRLFFYLFFFPPFDTDNANFVMLNVP